MSFQIRDFRKCHLERPSCINASSRSSFCWMIEMLLTLWMIQHATCKKSSEIYEATPRIQIEADRGFPSACHARSDTLWNHQIAVLACSVWKLSSKAGVISDAIQVCLLDIGWKDQKYRFLFKNFVMFGAKVLQEGWLASFGRQGTAWLLSSGP